MGKVTCGVAPTQASAGPGGSTGALQLKQGGEPLNPASGLRLGCLIHGNALQLRTTAWGRRRFRAEEPSNRPVGDPRDLRYLCALRGSHLLASYVISLRQGKALPGFRLAWFPGETEKDRWHGLQAPFAAPGLEATYHQHRLLLRHPL